MTNLAAPIRGSIPAFALVLALALVPGALAQVPQPQLTLTLEQDALELGAATTSSTILVNGTVAYADTAPAVPVGTTDGTITLAIAVPDGWTATLDPAGPFTLAPGASAPYTIELVAPAATVDANTFAMDVTGEATSGDGQRSASAATTLTIAQLALPPPPVPWYQTPGGIAGIVGAILLVVGIVVALVVRRNRRIAAAERAAYLARETGIGIEVSGTPIQYGHRREIMYRVAVTNKSDRPRVGIVEVAEITNGWRAALQFSKVPLSVGESRSVTLLVTPDAPITPGDRASVVVRAKPEEARELSEKVTIEVVAPKHGVPADPHYRIVTVHREGANMGVNR